jgi:hypothetical protein
MTAIGSGRAVAEDGALPLARRRLDDAVRGLADPTAEWLDGTCHLADSLYTRLRVALRNARVGRGSGQLGSAPCRIDVLTLLVEIDATVTAWEHGKSTVDRLHQLAGHRWRPQDCELIGRYCGELERWALSGVELLADAPRVFLHVPCPRCGERFAYRRDNAGERVRVLALRVSEHGCRCQGCAAFWPPEQFEWLAQLIGCTSPLV